MDLPFNLKTFSGEESILSLKSLETLEEQLSRIEHSLDEIANVLFKSNGHSVLSRMALQEQKTNLASSEMEKFEVMIHDLKTKMTVTELKIQLGETRNEKGDGKAWGVISIILSVLLSVGVQFIFRKLG